MRVGLGVTVGVLMLPAGCGVDDGAAAMTASSSSGDAGSAGGSDGGSAGDHDGDGSVDGSEDDDGGSAGDDSGSDDGSPLVCDSNEVACGNVCADLDSDPSNCGLCGRTCIITNAQAGCSAGECTMLECERGFSDCDGSLANGCEAEVDCSGAPCLTECGSTGAAMCDASCEQLCVAPPETCNAIDDDCNGECDEGAIAGCRAGVHRAYSPTLGHIFTTDLDLAQSGDFNLEAANFFYVYAAEQPDLHALYRCTKSNGRFLLTADTACEGVGTLTETVGYVAGEAQCGGIPLFRVHNPGSDSHFYTTSAAERDNAVANLGYVDEGNSGHIWGQP